MLKRIREFLTGRGATAPDPPPPPKRDEDRISLEVPAVHHGPKVVHQPIPLSDIDADAVKILRRLSRFDHTAYLVGGCVRDLLLDRHPKDFDIGTTATPRQVKRLFSNCRIIGRRFRLAHVYFQNGKIVEVATFRARDGVDDAGAPDEGEADLLIRDDNIFGTPEEDALRRDFTINALFYDVNDENVLDHTDGLGDLRRRLVRTIGDPEIRFREDPIRILRAIKFAARLDFEIEARTLEALRQTRNLIPRAASSRILEEINRFCRGGAARKSVEMLADTGVLEVVLPDFAASYREDPEAWRYLLHLLDAVDRRKTAGHEISTGAILVILTLPLLSRRMGWQRDGVSPRGRGVNVRDLADGMLRPMALQLRVARKDQEHCRQCLTALHRMVPARNLRHGVPSALAQRPCMPDCLWILEAVSHHLGGEFEEAFRFWSARVTALPAGEERHRPPHAPRADSPEPGQRTGEPSQRRRSRRSRRRTGAHRDSGVGAVAKVAAASTERAPQPKRKEGMPPPWDDRYFFAALPTVPQTSVEEGGDDTYDAPPSVESEDPPASATIAEPAVQPPAEQRPRSRRRRRRRRGGGGRGGQPPSGGSPEA